MALAAVGVLGAGAAAAQDFGSAIFSTYRSCAGNTICDGSQLGQAVLFPTGSVFGSEDGTGPSILTGGDMLSSSGSFNTGPDSSTSSITFLTPNSEPVMSGDVSTTAGDNVRTGSNGVAYYTYTNTSGVGVDLTLSASIAFDSSSATTGDPSLAGGAEYEASVAIVDPSYLAGQLSGPDSLASMDGLTTVPGVTAADIFAYNLELGVTAAACGTTGVDAYGIVTAATTGGAGNASVSSSACSGGGGYTVGAGDTVIIIDWYHLDANRGGEVDPLVMTYTDAPTPNALAVPEPATWALMLAGTAMLGGALRRRTRLEKLSA